MRAITSTTGRGRRLPPGRRPAAGHLLALRERCLKLGAELPRVERGAILALLGSAERAFYLIERIDAERKSVARVVPADVITAEPVPAELEHAAPAPA